MLPKQNRFSSSDFSLIKTMKPKKIFTDIGVFCVYENFPNLIQVLPRAAGQHLNSDINKFGIIVPKKIFKTAVSRNKHKRLFFNTLLEFKKTDNINSFVFYPKKIFNKEDVLHAIMSLK